MLCQLQCAAHQSLYRLVVGRVASQALPHAAVGLRKVRGTRSKRLAALPPKDFEGVLHPVFQEDEIKLIAVGGLLGMGVGFLQTLMYI